jgi:hypothetical protein
MPSLAESVQGQSQLNASLKAGLGVLSQNQTITFVKYLKMVLPLDGYNFWVRSSLITGNAAYNTTAYNTVAYNQEPPPTTDNEVTVKGSIHYAIAQRQGEDENLALNRVTFTSELAIQNLNDVSPTVMYLGEFNGIRFAFSERGKFYKAADIYHYTGDAVYPIMDSVIIDSAAEIDLDNVVVSNSLPIWLTFNQYFPVYPSFAVPDNIAPPYAVVHIAPNGTEALQSAPYSDKGGSQFQLVKDRVRITVFGVRNRGILDFMAYVSEIMLNTDSLGLMNMPVPRDDKRTQNEMNVLAIKKIIEYDVSYYQSTLRQLILHYIVSCIPSLSVA